MKNETYERVIKDYKFPIQLIPKYYEYYFDLYEDLFHTKTTLETFMRECEKSGMDEIEYAKYILDTKDKIICAIEESEAYKKFNAQDNPDFFVPKGIPKYSERTSFFDFTRKTDVYLKENEGKAFISVDLEKANFQMCKKYDSNLVLGAESYDEFIRQFIDSDYLIGSKYIRQIIFGNLAPKRQNLMEKYYTGKILSFLTENGFFNAEDIRIYTHDEIVFDSKRFLSEKETQRVYDAIYSEFGLKTHVESYQIKEICNNFFVKEMSDGTITFKGVPSHFFAQVYKKYLNKEIEKRDLAFLFEKQLCYFDEKLK